MLSPSWLKGMALNHPSQGILVVLQLSGGNDGLNTWIPFADPIYHDLRPNIRISKEDVIRVTGTMGWHPVLKGLAEIQQAGDLHIIQNVGYPQPNRSHFRSSEIWQTARPDIYASTGWLGHYLDHHAQGIVPAGITIDGAENLSLRGEQGLALTIQKPDKLEKMLKGKSAPTDFADSPYPQLDYVRALAVGAMAGAEEIGKALDKSPMSIGYPSSNTAKNLQWISRLIKGGLSTRVYYTGMGGFDTHALQKPAHANKLKEMSEAVLAFYKDLKQAGMMDKVTLMIYSEFGRRVKDNGSGTDHGTAAPLFIIQGKGRGKIHGPDPNLEDLDQGDVKMTQDFRAVYAGILKDVLKVDPKALGFDQVPWVGL